jgi:hypothetical protein
MLEFLIEFKPVILQFLDSIIRLFGVSFATLGIVYMFGRMLELLKTDRSKNILAIIVIYLFQFLYEFLDVSLTRIADKELVMQTLMDKGWSIFLFGAISIVIYVTVCWRLYSRIDNFLDKKVGDDEFTPTKKKDKKKTKNSA